jgi:hypothetical protein
MQHLILQLKTNQQFNAYVWGTQIKIFNYLVSQRQLLIFLKIRNLIYTLLIMAW